MGDGGETLAKHTARTERTMQEGLFSQLSPQAWGRGDAGPWDRGDIQCP